MFVRADVTWVLPNDQSQFILLSFCDDFVLKSWPRKILHTSHLGGSQTFRFAQEGGLNISQDMEYGINE
jgi:hypothetical protein